MRIRKRGRTEDGTPIYYRRKIRVARRRTRRIIRAAIALHDYDVYGLTGEGDYEEHIYNSHVGAVISAVHSASWH